MEGGPTQAVLSALASLQAKVHQLEKDRDYYVLECEKVTAKHKEDLREVETIARREKEEFQRRQQELRDAIQHSTDEKARLTRELDERRIEHARALREIEFSGDGGRKQQQEETHEVNLRTSQLRREVEENNRTLASLEAQLAITRREREVAEGANERLMRAVSEMKALPVPKGLITSSPMRRGRSPLPFPPQPAGGSRRAYEDPTVSWLMQRGMVKSQQPQANLSKIRGPSPKGPRVTRTRGPAVVHTGISVPMSGEPSELLDVLLRQLNEESHDLLLQYRQLVAQGRDPTSGVTAPETLTSTMNGLLRAMEKKAEQIHQIQQWKARRE